MKKTLISKLCDIYADSPAKIHFHIATHNKWVHSSEDYANADEELLEVLAILRKHNVQCNVITYSNALNGTTIQLEKFCLIRPDHTCDNWGHDYQALQEIVKKWAVWFYHPENPEGYYVDADMNVREAFEVDDGGC